MMSKKFNKQTPCDFGLITASEGPYAIDPKDGSEWLPCLLYDFGWGNENGYYRTPLPCYKELLQIVMESQDHDDIFGAAAIMLEKYPGELLDFCEKTLIPPVCTSKAQRIVTVFHLDQCINRSPIQGKPCEEIANDFNRWKKVSKNAQRFKLS